MDEDYNDRWEYRKSVVPLEWGSVSCGRDDGGAGQERRSLFHSASAPLHLGAPVDQPSHFLILLRKALQLHEDL